MPGDYDALLEVLDFTKGEGGAPRWSWRLTYGRGLRDPVQGDVDLRPGEGGENHPDNYRFLTDPYDFMTRKALDDVGEERNLRQLGNWLRTSVVTEPIWRALPTGRPSTVLVRLDGDGPEREVLRYPLALAADERGSLAQQHLTFVYDVQDRNAPAAVDLAYRAQDNSPLHIVGVFNRTEAGEPLDLHAEQTRVFKRVLRIAAKGDGKDITLNALAYHVTHAQLRQRMMSASRSSHHQDSRPWQMILHLADRGAPGSWSAVDETGRKTSLGADQLISMLQPGGNDLKLRLAVVTTRPASNPSLADQLEKFGVRSLRPDADDATTDAPVCDDQLPFVLARKLGCAVLAFRHRIADRSAIDIVEAVYENLLQQHLTLPRALAAAIEAHSDSLRPLDIAAPIIYGVDACGLKVEPPARENGRRDGGPPRQRPVHHLIGHHRPMWTASEIFSQPAAGEVNGAVLYGMEGVGKTTCATELISHYADDEYRTPILQYPRDGETMSADASEALKGFVAVLLTDQAIRQAFDRRDASVPGPAELDEFLSDETRFERLCLDVAEWLTGNENSNALVFLSDVKYLLSPVVTPGQSPWLHPYWTRLINAMAVRKAEGFRLLITSPYPLRLGPRMPDVPVPLLSPAEAFLYAVNLPHLGKVIGAAPGAMPDKKKRKLVHDVLSLADGHPGLLEYANQAAVKGEDHLRQLADTGIERLASDGQGQRPMAWREIMDWAVGALDRIPCEDPQYRLFLVLCRLIPAHRILERRQGEHPVPCLLSEVWATLHSNRAQRPPVVGAELEKLLQELREQSLIDVVELPGGAGVGPKAQIRIHPAIAEAAAPRDVELGDGTSLRAAVDQIAIQHTAGQVKEALRHRLYGGSADVQRLIPKALPYLERCGDWDTLLLLMAVLMARSRNNGGLDSMMDRVKSVLDKISNEDSTQFTMAARLLNVLEDLRRGGHPGLSVLLGEGPGDTSVDSSPLATAMGAGIIRGLRDTGRLQLARKVGADYLDHMKHGGPVSLTASAVETELLRVMVDQGEVTEALERTDAVFEALVDVRFRDAVHEEWADGEILRKKLFAIRRDSRLLLADDPNVDEQARRLYRDSARAAHLRLGQYLEVEGPTAEERHLYTVEGCLTGLDQRLCGDRDQLKRYDDELMIPLAAIERSGDIVLRAMTDVARARILREQACRADDEGEGIAAHKARQDAWDYELKALRQMHAEGTPMDVGACHRRIADDQLDCQSDQLTASTPVHQMYAAMIGDLTGAYLLRGRARDRELWRRRRAAGGDLPTTYQALCEGVREELGVARGDHMPGAPDPEQLLRRLVHGDPESAESELAEVFRRISADD